MNARVAILVVLLVLMLGLFAFGHSHAFQWRGRIEAFIPLFSVNVEILNA